MEKQKILAKFLYDITNTILIQCTQLKEALTAGEWNLQLKLKLIKEEIASELTEAREDLKKIPGKIQSSIKSENKE